MSIYRVKVEVERVTGGADERDGLSFDSNRQDWEVRAILLGLMREAIDNEKIVGGGAIRRIVQNT